MPQQHKFSKVACKPGAVQNVMAAIFRPDCSCVVHLGQTCGREAVGWGGASPVRQSHPRHLGRAAEDFDNCERRWHRKSQEKSSQPPVLLGASAATLPSRQGGTVGESAACEQAPGVSCQCGPLMKLWRCTSKVRVAMLLTDMPELVLSGHGALTPPLEPLLSDSISTELSTLLVVWIAGVSLTST